MQTSDAEKSGRFSKRWWYWFAAVLIATSIGIIGLAEAFAGKETITAQQYGAQWPWPSADSGVLKCRAKSFGGFKRPVVTINLNGIEYGLNGPAKGVAGYPDNQRLMVIAENGGYQLGASGAIIQRGLDLCWPSS